LDSQDASDLVFTYCAASSFEQVANLTNSIFPKVNCIWIQKVVLFIR